MPESQAELPVALVDTGNLNDSDSDGPQAAFAILVLRVR